MRYLDFLIENRRFLAFGLLMTFASSFGQTFYVSLYGAGIRESFDLSNAGFGGIFTVATIASAVTLIWLGRLIDRIDLRLYTGFSVAALVLAMVVVGLAPSLWVLVPALFLLRMSGQGLMMHISNTAMARYFEADRGKAVSVTSLGLPVGEALLPLVIVVLLAAGGWRGTWLAVAGVMGVAMALLLPVLLRGHGDRHAAFEARVAEDRRRGAGQRDWTARDVLRDPVYLAVVALFFIYPFVGTGLFFHQVWIAEHRGWPLTLMAQGFVAFAAAKVAASLAIGLAVDRYGSIRLFPTIALPMVAMLLVFALVEASIAPIAYYGLLGIGTGMLMPLMSGFLAERYGVANYGSIRAVSTAIMVLSTAAAPASFGWAFDAGVGLAPVAFAALAYTVVAAALVQAIAVAGRGGLRTGSRPR